MGTSAHGLNVNPTEGDAPVEVEYALEGVPSDDREGVSGKAVHHKGSPLGSADNLWACLGSGAQIVEI